MLEARTDWLALQVINIEFDTKLEDGPHLNAHRAELCTRVRKTVEACCYKLSLKAIETHELLMKDMAEELAQFYKVLPGDMFKEQVSLCNRSARATSKAKAQRTQPVKRAAKVALK